MMTDAEINAIADEAAAFLIHVDAKPTPRKGTARHWASIALQLAEAAALANARYLALALPAIPPPSINDAQFMSPRTAEALNLLKTTTVDTPAHIPDS